MIAKIAQFQDTSNAKQDITDREIWQRAIDMLNEIHEVMGISLVYKVKMERLVVDKIAEKHMKKLRDDMLETPNHYSMTDNIIHG